MSSTEYAELAGLNISLSRLGLTDEIHRDKEWVFVTTWMRSRIKQLESIKTR
jgi:hypothetical protein